MRGGVIEKDLAAGLIDEIPVLAVLGAASEEGLVVRDAQELRIKETDRIATVADNFGAAAWGSAKSMSSPTACACPGRRSSRAAAFDFYFGDHRMAMAFAVAALSGDGESTIDNADAASVSFPEFWNILERAAS